MISPRRHSIGLAALACLVAVCPASAAETNAQQAVGIKIGEGRLHPFLDVDGRYDSLVGFFTQDRTTNVPTGDVIIHVRPGLRFDLANKSTLVTFDGNVEYLFYLGLSDIASRNLSRFQASVALDAHFNQDGPVEFQIGDTFTRSDRTQNAIAGVGVQSFYNNAHLAVPIHPGGGALEFTPSFAFSFEDFSPLLTGAVVGCTMATCDPARVKEMNYINLNFGLGAKWKFLPKTAFILDSAFDFRTYWTPNSGNPNAGVLKVQAGLVGLITPKISVTLLAGYGGQLLTATQASGLSVNTFIAQAEVAYIPTELMRFSLGYSRSVAPTPGFGVFGDDRGYLGARAGFLGGRLSLSATASLDYLTFYANSGRNDLLISVNAGPTFDVTSWFQVGAGYTLSTRSAFGTASGLSSANFVRHEALLRLTLRY